MGRPDSARGQRAPGCAHVGEEHGSCGAGGGGASPHISGIPAPGGGASPQPGHPRAWGRGVRRAVRPLPRGCPHPHVPALPRGTQSHPSRRARSLRGRRGVAAPFHVRRRRCDWAAACDVRGLRWPGRCGSRRASAARAPAPGHLKGTRGGPGGGDGRQVEGAAQTHITHGPSGPEALVSRSPASRGWMRHRVPSSSRKHPRSILRPNTAASPPLHSLRFKLSRDRLPPPPPPRRP